MPIVKIMNTGVRLPIVLGILTLAAGLLSGCNRINADVERITADVEKGPVLLQCDGDSTTHVLSSSTTARRYVFRVDGRANTFEIWNDQMRSFAPWGNGDLRIGSGQITYTADETSGGAFALRHLTIDRSTGKIEDDITISAGGSLHFEGKCDVANSPEPLPKKF